MKLVMISVLMVLAACGDQMAAVPDAPLASVRDRAFYQMCDKHWAVDGVQPFGCSYACLTKPVEMPCGGALPCADQGACVGASSDGLNSHDCASTFLAEDYLGPHQGCCVVEFQDIHGTPTPRPTFYECP